MSIIQIMILALVQGAAELLPVSSSAHVIAAEKLMGLDPTSPEMTFLLVMLHTGTMFAVLFYFWKRWKLWFFQGAAERTRFLKLIATATIATIIVGGALKVIIEKIIFKHVMHVPHTEIEHLFGYLPLIAASLVLVGILIIVAGCMVCWKKDRVTALTNKTAGWIGVEQGLCLPFRGFSRSGATISTGLILGIPRELAEEFSFVLAVVLTPPVVWRETHRLIKVHALGTSLHMFVPGLMGMVLAFGAGLLALKWLASWLEKGRWQWFGIYCFAAAAGILWIHLSVI